MSNPSTILIADFVPLANRGEEAILRGIEDLLGQGGDLRVGIFDDVTAPMEVGRVTVFPWRWIFRAQGNLNFAGLPRQLHDMAMTVQMRGGYWGPLRNLLRPSQPALQALADFFARSDLVLVGHDGVFCTESCGVIHLAKQAGKRVGILGASVVLAPKARAYKGWLYRQALDECDFCLFRERYAQESLSCVATTPEKLQVAPDPAFAMIPASASAAESLLTGHSVYRQARAAGRPVIVATVLEKGRVYAGFRPALKGQEKRNAQARYLATLLKGLIDETNALVVFLPHAVEADASDIEAAWRVTGAMAVPERHTLILEQDLDARTLKAIIRAGDFLVGQRTHSLIGAVGVGTPFVGLTNARDTRTHGIIGGMCLCEDQLIDMEAVSAESALRKLLTIWSQRQRLAMHLGAVMAGLSKQLQELAAVVMLETG